MGRRSQLVALAIAFVVAAAALPATARAEDSCRANPTGAARDGKHWYYQTDQETQQRCWFLGARKTGVTKAALRSFFDAMDQAQPAQQMMAAGCAIAPDSRAPRGRRWLYQIDPGTGQKCWHLSGRMRSVKAAPARTPPPIQLAAEPAKPLSQPIADAQASMPENAPASLSDANLAAAPSDATVSSASGPAEPAIHGELPILTFESRWSDDFKMAAAGDGQPSRSGNPATHRSAAADRRAGFFGNAARMLAAGPPLVDILVVSVATLGSVIILLGFLDWSFLFRTPASSAQEHRSPLTLPQLDAESDRISAWRPGRDDMLSLFAPTATAAATGFGAASRFLVETV